jgi:hypothetical protein
MLASFTCATKGTCGFRAARSQAEINRHVIFVAVGERAGNRHGRHQTGPLSIREHTNAA